MNIDISSRSTIGRSYAFHRRLNGIPPWWRWFEPKDLCTFIRAYAFLLGIFSAIAAVAVWVVLSTAIYVHAYLTLGPDAWIHTAGEESATVVAVHLGAAIAMAAVSAIGIVLPLMYFFRGVCHLFSIVFRRLESVELSTSAVSGFLETAFKVAGAATNRFCVKINWR